jgi:hypothetical protein
MFRALRVGGESKFQYVQLDTVVQTETASWIVLTRKGYF